MPEPAQSELVSAVLAVEGRGWDICPLAEGDGVVQAHLGGLARLAGAALGVAADRRYPAGVCRELVRNVLEIEVINSQISQTAGVTTFLSATVGFSDGQ